MEVFVVCHMTSLTSYGGLCSKVWRTAAAWSVPSGGGWWLTSPLAAQLDQISCARTVRDSGGKRIGILNTHIHTDTHTTPQTHTHTHTHTNNNTHTHKLTYKHTHAITCTHTHLATKKSSQVWLNVEIGQFTHETHSHSNTFQNLTASPDCVPAFAAMVDVSQPCSFTTNITATPSVFPPSPLTVSSCT